MQGKPSFFVADASMTGPERARTPLLAMGFRIFFVLAGLYGLIAMLYWPALLYSWVPGPKGISPTYWHAHEMVFGYGLAVVAGFLLTAVRNWTRHDTAHGDTLMILGIFWLLGRVSLSLGGLLPRAVLIGAGVLFPLGLTWAVARSLITAKNKRNYIMIGVLVAMSVVELLLLIDLTGAGWNLVKPALWAAVLLVVVLNVVIGGRVIPMFTRNATGAPGITKNERLDQIATWTTVALVPLLLLSSTLPAGVSRWLVGGLAVFTGAVNIVRQRTWGWRPALKDPMLWVLHAGYLCIGLGLISIGLVYLLQKPLQMATAMHVLTVGVIGTMTVGMMTRVSFGHTGRKIVAPKGMGLAFALVLSATLVRSLGHVLTGEYWPLWIFALSSLLFAAALALLSVQVLPILFKPRFDGKPG